MPLDPRRVKELFVAASELADPQTRQALLDRECGADAELRERIDVLLAAHDAPHPALNQPLVAEAPGATAAYESLTAPAEAVGSVIAGKYKLLQEIGEGGMGSVFMADQLHPVKRRVAVKVIKAGMDSARVLARFEAERQALALMDHPNIAKVLDAGTTDTGRPFFVMELVKGIPLTQFCDEHKLPVLDRLNLFMQVCSAVQHAHQKGIIHRDLKPTNILVESHDGKPVPKAIDFGLAKATSGMQLTEHTLFTALGQVAGTPLYMAPEQVAFNAIDVDTRADIYSLGVILYELLTGTTPIERETFKKAAFDEMLRVIREQEPPTPSSRLSSSESKASVAALRQMEPAKLGRFVRGELDWIVMKSLSKERDRRYESATAFAKDVERFLNHEPVQAGPPSAAYKLRKFVRRNRPQVIAVAVVLLALVAGMAGTTWGLVEANRARRQAEFERDEKDRARLLADQRRTEAESARQAESEQRQAAEAAEHAARESEADTKAYSTFLVDDMLMVARPEGERGGLGIDVTVRQALDVASKQISERFRGRPRAEAIARHDLGITYRLIGELEAAETMLREALRLRQHTLSPDDEDTLNTQNSLAVLLRARGKYAEALTLFEETLKLNKAKLGPDDPHTLTYMNNLAGTYQDAGRLQDALPLHEETLKLQRAKFGLDHPSTVVSMSNLARAYLAAGRVQEALPLHEQALKLRKAGLGPDHPDTLTSMRDLGGSYLAVGRHQDLLALGEETLKLSKAKLGPDHPDTLTAMSNLAVAYGKVGRRTDALPLLEETLKLRKDKLGPGHPYTLQSMNSLAMQYRATGRSSEALPLFEETLKLRTATLGAKHPETLRSMNYLAEEYHTANRLPEALPLYEEALNLMKANLGPEHSDTLLTMGNLARAYLDTKQPEQAFPLLAGYLAGKRKQLGPENPALAETMALVAQKLLGHEHYVEAEKVLRECLTIREKTLPDDWVLFNTKSMLGGALAGQKKFQEAEPLLVEGYSGMKEREAKIPPAAQPRLAEAIRRLVDLYTAWEKAEEAAKWRKELEESNTAAK